MQIEGRLNCPMSTGSPRTPRVRASVADAITITVWPATSTTCCCCFPPNCVSLVKYEYIVSPGPSPLSVRLAGSVSFCPRPSRCTFSMGRTRLGDRCFDAPGLLVRNKLLASLHVRTDDFGCFGRLSSPLFTRRWLRRKVAFRLQAPVIFVTYLLILAPSTVRRITSEQRLLFVSEVLYLNFKSLPVQSCKVRLTSQCCLQ